MTLGEERITETKGRMGAAVCNCKKTLNHRGDPFTRPLFILRLSPNEIDPVRFAQWSSLLTDCIPNHGGVHD